MQTSVRAMATLALVLLIASALRASAEALFLSDGTIVAFDGQQSRVVGPPPQAAAARSRFRYLFDSKPAGGTKRFLLAGEPDSRFRPDSDAPAGVELWLREEAGAKRLVHPSVYRARFSPDGGTIAYTTSDCELRVEDRQGRRLHTVRGAYNPHWKHDGSAVLFENVPTGRDKHRPETLHLARLDTATGKVDLLTDGRFDDVRPEFHPSDKWILFVSGGRTGIASFWKISAAGGEPKQVTNVGLKQLDETFVPTPYQTTIWSADGRWFVYDFKNGETRQIWGLEFDGTGKMLRALRLADGLNPQWLEDGKTFAYERRADGNNQPGVGRLP